MTSRLLEELIGIQFFGEYLIDRWIITREQLLEALAYQMERNERFGEIALRRGYLSEEQIKRVNDRQRVTDRTFGEIAVEMGLLDDKKVDDILTFQRNNNIHLGEVLLRLGFVTEDVLQRELGNYRERQNRYRMDGVDFLENTLDRELVVASVDVTRKVFLRVVGMVVKVGRAVRMAEEAEAVQLSYAVSVEVPFLSGTRAVYVLAVSQGLAQRIAKSMLGDDEDAKDAKDVKDAIPVADAVAEFCNIVCGNTVAKLAKLGYDVTIAPPSTSTKIPDPPAGFTAIAFPVRSTDGGAEMRFFVSEAASGAATE
jgi:CheY-specific phosphatase CheX